MKTPPLSRRSAMKAATALAAAPFVLTRRACAAEHYRVQHDRIHQSVVPWCFKPMPPEELIEHSHKLGLKSVELIDPKYWPELQKRGMTCAICGSHGFARGLANADEQAECLKMLEERIELCAKNSVPSIITFSGMKKGAPDEVMRKNMVEGLKKIARVAEAKRVTVCPEMLNTKVAVEMKGHPGYWFNDMDEAIKIIKEVGSERVKVLFDIYHVQIMHGDIIARIRQYAPYIGHVHTAGNPGRNEIDGTQEINYPPIMKALLEVKYTGYVGQEFIPLRDKVQSLSEAVKLCDV
jgi:hydroxypyruvate isomerase